MQCWRDVAVDPERDGNRRVAEPLLHDLRVNALLEGERRPRMSEAVDREAGESVARDAAQEGIAHSVRSEPRAVGLVEREAEVVEVRADEEALLAHAMAVRLEHGDGAA